MSVRQAERWSWRRQFLRNSCGELLSFHLGDGTHRSTFAGELT
jgi:hypothetical protein